VVERPATLDPAHAALRRAGLRALVAAQEDGVFSRALAEGLDPNGFFVNFTPEGVSY
jgi:hypothetical protein